MDFQCACGFKTNDEVDFLAHLTECKLEPEEHWATYTNIMDTETQSFKNSEILEEGNK